MNKKNLTKLVGAALILAVIPGCASKTNKVTDPALTLADATFPSYITEADTRDPSAPDNTDTTDGTAEGSEESEESEESDKQGSVSLDDEKVSAIVENYIPSPEDSAALKSEDTKKPIVFSGFSYEVVGTPVKSEGTKIDDTLVPIYSHEGLHSYIEENSAIFDLSKLDEIKEKYGDEFFGNKCLLIVSLEGTNTGSDYSVTGAWYETDINNMDRLVFAIKTAAGDMKSSHVLIELETDFLNLWDTWGIEYYN